MTTTSGWFKFRINILFLSLGFLIDFTDIPEQLWLKVFPINQITLVNIILKSPWFLLSFPFAFVHTCLLNYVCELKQIVLLCILGLALCLVIVQLLQTNSDKWNILILLTLIECVPAFSVTILNGYMVLNATKYNGRIASDIYRMTMIGQFLGRCVSGVIYGEDNIQQVFFAFGFFILLFGHVALLCNYCSTPTYVNVVDEELGEPNEPERGEEPDKEIIVHKNPRPHLNALLLFTIQPSAATAVFYLVTGPFGVSPSSITNIKTFLALVRLIASFTGSLSHLSGNNLSFVLHIPIVFAHVGYMFFVSQNYTFSIDDKVVYLLIGIVSSFAYTIFNLAWNDTMCVVASQEKGREAIVMAKWTTMFYFVSTIPNFFEYILITNLGIDHGNFDKIYEFAFSCFIFTCMTWSIHRLFSICGIIL